MADNKQWFKVWTSMLTDPNLASLHNQTVGCWLRLCALTAQHGTDGKLTIPQHQLLVTLHISTAPQNEINQILNELKTLNISMDEEVQKGCVTNVTLQIINWAKYQAYSDSYERVNKFRKLGKERYKCNVEKKRREEKRKEENKKRKELKEIIYPEWLPLEIFNDFKEKRKEIKKPLTGNAEKLVIEELLKLKEAGHDPQAVLKQSIINSWQGVFPIKPQYINPKRSWED